MGGQAIDGQPGEIGMVARFIVAEVSKNYPGTGFVYSALPVAETLAGRFEQVINFNLDRGYRLHSWRFSQINTSDGSLNETIVAVFEPVETA